MHGTAVKLSDKVPQKKETSIEENSLEFNEFNKLKKLIIKRDRVNSPEEIDYSLLKELKLNNLLNSSIANIYVNGIIENRGLYDCGDFLPSLPVEFYKNIFFYRIEKLSAYALNQFLNALSLNNWFDKIKIIQMLKSDKVIIRLRALKLVLLNKAKFNESDIVKYSAILEILKSGVDIERDVEVVDKLVGKEVRIFCANCLGKVKMKRSGHCVVCNANKMGFVESSITRQPYFVANDYWDIISEIENRINVLEEVL